MLCWCFLLIFIYKLLNAKYSLFLTHTVFIFKQVHFENCVMLKAVNILQTISIEQFVSCTCFLLKRIYILSLGYITMYVCIYHNYGCVDKNMFFFTYLLFLVMYIFPLSSYVKENLSFKTVLSSSTIVQPIEKKSDRREGKGRHCWLGERIDSIPCCTRDLAPVHTTPNHHPPKMAVLQKTFLQIIIAS